MVLTKCILIAYLCLLSGNYGKETCAVRTLPSQSVFEDFMVLLSTADFTDSDRKSLIRCKLHCESMGR